MKTANLTPAEIELVLKHRANQISLENISSNSALTEYCAERGIDMRTIVSVKHWQNMGGEPRFSIVTKDDTPTTDVLFEQVHSFISEHAPHYKKGKYKKPKKNDSNHLLVINPADIHIGKYASGKETRSIDYNCEVAVTQVIDGVFGLLKKAQGFHINKILFCIGNDVLHVDNVYGATTKGTHQDTDGKWWEHYDKALAMYVKCVEILKEIAPVDCIHSMSNHDYQSGYHLAKTLEAWFRNCEDVNVMVGASHRNYYRYGNSLIGLEHGDGAKMDKLPLLMANENPKDWANTKYRYWYLHHLHHKIKHKWRDGKDFIGVSVEYLRSPSAADSWHSRKGYKGSPRAVEAFIHEEEYGQIARLTHFF